MVGKVGGLASRRTTQDLYLFIQVSLQSLPWSLCQWSFTVPELTGQTTVYEMETHTMNLQLQRRTSFVDVYKVSVRWNDEDG